MTPDEQEIVDILEKKAAALRKKLATKGGRGVDLAEHVDRLEAAVDALKGELVCQGCGRQLTGS